MSKEKDNQKDNKKRVLLGLSGGVDSTAAALLLQNAGYEVTGCYMDINEINPPSSIAQSALMLPQTVLEISEKLGIKTLYKNQAELFKETVISDFCRAYGAGETPNPCIICNPAVKFTTLLDIWEAEGYVNQTEKHETVDRINLLSTGHYAKVVYDETLDTWFIEKGTNLKKDQSYMLYRLPQAILSRLLLPLGEIADKEDIRALVREISPESAKAKDSQEICFIPRDTNYVEFLKQYHLYKSEPKIIGDDNLKLAKGLEKGDFVNKEGNILGRHQGLVNYTVGQRKGLGITFGEPRFVIGLDPASNRVILGKEEDLYSYKVCSKDNIFSYGDSRELPEFYAGIPLEAKIRYAAPPAEVILEALPGGRVEATFKKPQRAVTPGQSIVFYEGNRVIGGGIIEKAL